MFCFRTQRTNADKETDNTDAARSVPTTETEDSEERLTVSGERKHPTVGTLRAASENRDIMKISLLSSRHYRPIWGNGKYENEKRKTKGRPCFPFSVC